MKRFKLKEVEKMLEGTTISHSGNGVADLGMADVFDKFLKMTDAFKASGTPITACIFNGAHEKHCEMTRQSCQENAPGSEGVFFFFGAFEVKGKDYMFCLGHNGNDDTKKLMLLSAPGSDGYDVWDLSSDQNFASLKALLKACADPSMDISKCFNSSLSKTFEKNIPKTPKPKMPRR